MTSRRGRITRFIAAIVTIALTTQIAGAQVANCIASHESSGHAAMLHHTSGNSFNAENGGSHALRSLACSQSVLCLNAPAVLDVIVRPVQVARIASPIVCDPSTLEARSLCPDSPPPKI